MSRPRRYIPEGGALVEVTLRTIQGRYLLRPDQRGRVNLLPRVPALRLAAPD